MTNFSWAIIILIIFVVANDIWLKIRDRRKLAEDDAALALKIKKAKLKYSIHHRNAFYPKYEPLKSIRRPKN